MNIDTFMSQQAVGSRGYDPKKIVVVETTLGYVWASRLTLMLPTASAVRLGLPNKGPTLVGRSFLWPWYPSKAVYAFEGEVEKTHLDGMFRELSQFKPTRAIINTNLLSPDIIKGAVDVTDKLCPGELAFFSMLAPSRAWCRRAARRTTTASGLRRTLTASKLVRRSGRRRIPRARKSSFRRHRCVLKTAR